MHYFDCSRSGHMLNSIFIIPGPKRAPLPDQGADFHTARMTGQLVPVQTSFPGVAPPTRPKGRTPLVKGAIDFLQEEDCLFMPVLLQSILRYLELPQVLGRIDQLYHQE